MITFETKLFFELNLNLNLLQSYNIGTCLHNYQKIII